MSKFRVVFDVDLEKICPEALAGAGDTVESAEVLLSRMLLEAARKNALKDVQRVRQSNLSAEEKSIAMAECLRRAKLALQAEANMTVEALPDSAVVLDDIPERVALAA